VLPLSRDVLVSSRLNGVPLFVLPLTSICDNVPALVASDVGGLVGTLAVTSVGTTVGPALAGTALVGSRVDAAVGKLVGALVGALVGTLVGALVGALVGTLVGALVGALVGTRVGEFVGLMGARVVLFVMGVGMGSIVVGKGVMGGAVSNGPSSDCSKAIQYAC